MSSHGRHGHYYGPPARSAYAETVTSTAAAAKGSNDDHDAWESAAIMSASSTATSAIGKQTSGSEKFHSNNKEEDENERARALDEMPEQCDRGELDEDGDMMSESMSSHGRHGHYYGPPARSAYAETVTSTAAAAKGSNDDHDAWESAAIMSASSTATSAIGKQTSGSEKFRSNNKDEDENERERALDEMSKQCDSGELVKIVTYGLDLVRIKRAGKGPTFRAKRKFSDLSVEEIKASCVGNEDYFLSNKALQLWASEHHGWVGPAKDNELSMERDAAPSKKTRIKAIAIRPREGWSQVQTKLTIGLGLKSKIT